MIAWLFRERPESLDAHWLQEYRRTRSTDISVEDEYYLALGREAASKARDRAIVAQREQRLREARTA